MALSATRLALATLLLGSSAAHAGWFDLGSSKKAVAKDDKAVAAQPSPGGTSLEDSIRQAHMLRLAGNYPEAIDLTDILYHRHRETIASRPPDPEVVGLG